MKLQNFQACTRDVHNPPPPPGPQLLQMSAFVTKLNFYHKNGHCLKCLDKSLNHIQDLENLVKEGQRICQC